MGKTALAVHWAHRVAGRFPDGQLYVNLHGYDIEQPMTAGDALARFLAALGVPETRIPLAVDERAARYRSEVAGRRLLIVLGNASSVEQVRPLLPGTISCAVVVTSRDSLAGLVARDGAQRLDVDLLPADDAAALLRRLVGARVDNDLTATMTFAHLCARLPLALRVAAELTVSRPATPLADLVTELDHQQRRLDLLDAGGDPHTAVTAVFSWSLRNLPAEAVATFALLSQHPGPDLDAYAAAALAGTSLDRAHGILDRLARSHLIHSTRPGRYAMHDLLRAYAAGLSTAGDDAAPARAALCRLFDYYSATAAAAANSLYPAEAHHRPRIGPACTPTPDLTDPDTALRWLETERPCLVAAAAHTASHGWPAHTIQLSAILYRYLCGGHIVDALTIHQHADAAARQIGDRAGRAHALLGLGQVYGRLSQIRPATQHLRRALALFRKIDDPLGQACVLTNLGAIEKRRCRNSAAATLYAQALDLFRRAGDRIGEAGTLVNIGIIDHRWSRYEQAADNHRRALTLFRLTGDHYGQAIALLNLGIAEKSLGRRQAADHHRQAIALFQRMGSLSGQAAALDDLGILQTHQRRPDLATASHRQALAIFRDIGERYGEVTALNGLGEAALTAGSVTDALTHHSAAITVATKIGAPDQRARAHTGLGRAYLTLNDRARARQHFQHADLDPAAAEDVRHQLATLD